MFKVAIIGAGQLGSRHLQGLKGASSPLSITVVDSSEDSLKVAQERYDAISAVGEKEVKYVSGIDSLPKTLDLVIVATGSKPRAAIVKSLLDTKSVTNLVLEKVLFPELSAYDEIAKLLSEEDVRCWVNCPRRMYGMYQEIAKLIDVNKPLRMVYGDENWGLCCNSIHEIDLFMYLIGENKYSIDTTSVNPQIEPSKRNGYIEMTGTLVVKTPKGNELVLTSVNGFDGKAGITITNGEKIIYVDETHGFWLDGNIENRFSVPYQSQLSGILADELLTSGTCQLSSYELSASYHKPFIIALLQKYNEIEGLQDNKLLPIT